MGRYQFLNLFFISSFLTILLNFLILRLKQLTLTIQTVYFIKNLKILFKLCSLIRFNLDDVIVCA